MPILLTPGDDNVSYVTANDPLEIYGLGGNDTIAGGNASDTIDGGDGNDTIRDLGGFGNDHFIGGIGNDVLTAVAGADWLEAGDGNDVGQGGAGDDVIDGGPGNDALDGEADNDTIYAGTGQDFVIGGDGNDVIVVDGSYADGTDTVRGGDGNDVYILGGSNIAFYATDPGLDRIEVGFSFSLAGLDVEDITLTGSAAANATGNERANTLSGNDAANLISGEGGNDLIRGFGGNDTLSGGPGGGVEYLYGGLNDDTYNVEDLDDTPVEFSGEGFDTVRSPIRWVLGANLESLVLTGSASVNAFGNELANLIVGNSGNNYLQGFVGLDTLVGGLGNDYYELSDLTFIGDAYGWEYDTIGEYPNGGLDTISLSSLGNSNYTLPAGIENLLMAGSAGMVVFGNTLDNTFTGNSGNNQFYGDGGADTLNGAGGIDQLYGNAGNDAYILDDIWQENQFARYQFDVVGEAAGEGVDTVFVRSLADPDQFGTNGYTLTDNVENGAITGPDAFNLTGNASDNLLLGNGAANRLTGNGGADTLNGGLALDQLAGSTGDDTYVLGDTTNVGGALQFDGVAENPGEGTDTALVSSDVGRLTYVLDPNVEQATATGISPFNLVGNALANRLTGNQAVNVLTGDAGNDTLDGGLGADIMNGGAGNDTYCVDTREDVVVESGGRSGGVDTVNSTYRITLAADLENLLLLGTAGIDGTGNGTANRITGNSGNNVLLGMAGQDTLSGGDGNDELRGDTGADRMVGGLGNDRYFVDDTGDIVNEATAGPTGGIDTLFSTLSMTLGANLENLRLQGAAGLAGTGNDLNNSIYGTTGADLLRALAGPDTINGRDGNDTIDGGTANDTISGGGGLDVYRFASSNAGVDTITDFSRNFDRFDLSGGSFTAVGTAPNGDTVLTHAGGAIRIQNPPNLTLAQWNALVVSSESRLAHGVVTADEDPAHVTAHQADAFAFAHHAEWAFA